MSVCRYEPRVDCYGPGTPGIASCGEGCSGPVDLSNETGRPGNYQKPGRKTAKPAAPPAAREEGKTMAAGQPAEIGKCQKCGGEGEKLYQSKSHPGAYCKKCNKAAMNKAFNAKRAGQQSATKAHDAAKAKSAGASKAEKVIAKPGPARDPLSGLRLDGKHEEVGSWAMTNVPNPTGRTFVPLTARDLAFSLGAAEVGLLVTCRKMATMLAVIRAAESDSDVMIAVGAKG
jgi:hypothetical protein